MAAPTSEPILRGMTLEMEYVWLGTLIADCQGFCDRWKQVTPHKSETSADAIVAVLDLEELLVERRRCVLMTLNTEVTPF